MVKFRAMTNLEWHRKYNKHAKNAYVGYTDNDCYGFVVDYGSFKTIISAFIANQPYKTKDGKYIMVRCN